MPLSWNEIKDRALTFSREWADESRETAESQSFWNDFFDVFGINRRRVASFEEPVKKLGERRGEMDLFWKGMLIAEHKAHQALDRAVDAAYGRKNFASDAEHVAFLFELYQKLTSLLPKEERRRKPRRKAA